MKADHQFVADILTFDRVQHSVVQRFPTRIVGGRANPCSAAIGQGVSMETKRSQSEGVYVRTRWRLMDLLEY